jgi:uncharacterized protein (DUF486 family)
MKSVFIVLLLFIAAGCMVFAWLGHLKYNFSFFKAFLFSWAIVIPEYLLNTYATRMGSSTELFTKLQMSAISIVSGVVIAYLMSIFFFREVYSQRDLIGMSLISIGVLFMFYK